MVFKFYKVLYTKDIPKYCERIIFLKPVGEIHSPIRALTPNLEKLSLSHY